MDLGLEHVEFRGRPTARLLHVRLAQQRASALSPARRPTTPATSRSHPRCCGTRAWNQTPTGPGRSRAYARLPPRPCRALRP